MQWLAIISIILFLLVIILFFLYNSTRKKLIELEEIHHQVQFDLRSTRVKHGKSWEHFVPFMENYPGDKDNSVFIGMPIDFISFGEDSVKFIEVKTGSSKLNKKQKHIKELIEDKKVEWHELEYE